MSKADKLFQEAGYLSILNSAGDTYTIVSKVTGVTQEIIFDETHKRVVFNLKPKSLAHSRVPAIGPKVAKAIYIKTKELGW